jgi:Domain of unknown function (DUF5668)
MNCANHPAVSNAAFCRTCGKPLCANCTRDVQGVIYCETCLAERLHGVQPPQAAAAQPGTNPGPVYVSSGSGPNAALAGILSIFPGVGTVYCGQYVKGFAYMGVFVFLILGTIHLSGLIFGLALGFFCVYQMIDAVRTAHAIQAGLPIPDPLGLTQIFGTGEPVYPVGTPAVGGAPEPARIPTGAVVLIALGVLFLLETAGWLGDFGVDKLWPLILIGLGVWLFAKRRGLVGTRYRRDGYPPGKCNFMGPVVLVTVGTLFLIQSLDGPDFGRTWPVLLLAIGLVKLLDSKNPPPPQGPPVPPAPGTTYGDPSAGQVSPPSSEVHNG